MKVKLTPKQYLSQAYHLNELIDTDIAELDQLKATIDGLSSIRFDRENVQTSGFPASPIERTITKIESMKEKINREIDDFIDLKEQIRDSINQLQNTDERLILRLKYVLFKEWLEIQTTLSREESQVYSLHQKALNHFKVPEGRFSYRETE